MHSKTRTFSGCAPKNPNGVHDIALPDSVPGVRRLRALRKISPMEWSELRHTYGVAIWWTLDSTPERKRLLEHAFSLLDQEDFDERPCKVGIIQCDSERCGEIRLESMKLRAQRLRYPELEGDVGLRGNLCFQCARSACFSLSGVPWRCRCGAGRGLSLRNRALG